MAAIIAETLKDFLSEGLIHNDHVLGLLESLVQFTERRVRVSIAVFEGWMAISRFHSKGLVTEDSKTNTQSLEGESD